MLYFAGSTGKHLGGSVPRALKTMVVIRERQACEVFAGGTEYGFHVIVQRLDTVRTGKSRAASRHEFR